MKHFLPAVLLIGCATFAMAAEPLPALPVASAPAIPQPASPAASGAVQSPAVKAAGKAILPGKLRPENPVVPQVVLSRSAKDKSVDSLPKPGATADKIDQRAARCAAQESRAERERCEAAH